MAEQHRLNLLDQLGSGSRWSWVPRLNPAAAHPTDFGLIQCDSAATLDAIRAARCVRDVHADREVSLGLKEWVNEADLGPLHGFDGGDGVEKAPGRLQTRPSFGLQSSQAGASTAAGRRLLGTPSVTQAMGADALWRAGYSGAHIRMGVFDTGIPEAHPHVRNIKERTNWTSENTLADSLGHGTFVAGVVSGQDVNCPGFAPDVLLHTFKVFTNDQVSYTSWFLDAFNYAIAINIHVINLSIGGPDYLDAPFVQKVLEVTSNGILLVSAIGNDGPLWGTLNNPADQMDVIGVGGIDYSDRLAQFSSRGMSTWELPAGYGRAKPDVMAYGKDVHGSKISGGCRPLSGTSVASPVVAGAVCLLASTVPEEQRWQLLNPGSMKQALVEGAQVLPSGKMNIFEQGNGKIDLAASKAILAKYSPRASIVPSKLDFTSCPYFWPFCTQPLYAHAMPVMFNATVLNGMGVTGTFASPPVWTPTNSAGAHLRLRFEHGPRLWPWSGHLALFITVDAAAEDFSGTATGTVSFTVESPPGLGETEARLSTVTQTLIAAIVPTPPREKRLLWDQFHSIKYPPGYVPRDNLEIRSDILDWNGDHPHTNFHGMYDSLNRAGYFLEVLGSPYTCFDAAQYGALLVVDSEEEFYPEEVVKLEADVRDHGLAVLVFAEWYSVEAMASLKFFDDNTRSWWWPVTGGGNVPALNDLLAPYGVALGDSVLKGEAKVGAYRLNYVSGTHIVRFPAGGHVIKSGLKAVTDAGRHTHGDSGNYGVMGMLSHGDGKLGVYGDASCLDSNHMSTQCFDMLLELLQWGVRGTQISLLAPQYLLSAQLGNEGMQLPRRPDNVDFKAFSTVLSTPIACQLSSQRGFDAAEEAVVVKPAQDDALFVAEAAAGGGDSEGGRGAWQGASQRASRTASSITDVLTRLSVEEAARSAEHTGGRAGAADAHHHDMVTVAGLLALVGILLMVAIWRLTGRSSKGLGGGTRRDHSGRLVAQSRGPGGEGAVGGAGDIRPARSRGVSKLV